MHNTVRVKFVFSDMTHMITNMLPVAATKKNLEDLRQQYNAIGFKIIS